MTSFRGYWDGSSIVVPSVGGGTCRFHFHACTIQALPLSVGVGADTAVFNFSISQIVRTHADAVALFHSLLGERSIRRCSVVAHDHTKYASRDWFVHGTACRILHGTGCDRCAALVCVCDPPHFCAARLSTTIAGTKMAVDIEEWAFSADAFLRSLRPSSTDFQTMELAGDNTGPCAASGRSPRSPWDGTAIGSWPVW